MARKQAVAKKAPKFDLAFQVWQREDGTRPVFLVCVDSIYDAVDYLEQRGENPLDEFRFVIVRKDDCWTLLAWAYNCACYFEEVQWFEHWENYR